MTKRKLICFLATFLPLAGMALADRPNIILVMADDQGWEETGYNGHPVVRTPVLDEMAKQGLRFDRFYSAAPNCGPTRGSIMTGRHSNRYGLFAPNWAMRPEEVTLGQLVKSAGYATGHFGKWHLGPVKAGAPNNPGAAGFDEWLSHDNFFEMDPVLVRNGSAPEKHPGESSEIVVDAAIEFIGKAVKDDKPFFTIIWFGSPHGPYIASEEDKQPYASAVSDVLANRYGEITAMDRAIGKLRQFLRAENISSNTLLWYCSDNGVPGDVNYQPKLRGSKGTLYENGVRVPAIIEWPQQIPHPRTTGVRVVTTDIFPTVCQILNIPLPERILDGISIVDLINGKMDERPVPIAFWKYNSAGEKKNGLWLPAELQKGTTPTARNPGIEFLNYKHPVPKKENFGGDASLLGNRYKLVVPKKGGPELYDLSEDDAEQINLADKKPEVVERMMQQLIRWQTSVENSLSGADY